jgi:hypothetical protein
VKLATSIYPTHVIYVVIPALSASTPQPLVPVVHMVTNYTILSVLVNALQILLTTPHIALNVPQTVVGAQVSPPIALHVLMVSSAM